jgi:hypothetical protein
MGLFFDPNMDNPLTEYYGRSYFTVRLRSRDIQEWTMHNAYKIKREIESLWDRRVSSRYEDLFEEEGSSGRYEKPLVFLKVIKKHNQDSVFIFGIDLTM